LHIEAQQKPVLFIELLYIIWFI